MSDLETTWTVLRTIVAVVGSIGILGGVLASLAGFAYLLFKRFATSWLDQRFKKDFADYTHRHNQEIETMKARFAETLNRTTNLHAQEFEILPKAWGLLTSAIAHVGEGLTAYLRQETIHEMGDRNVRMMMKVAEFSEEDIELVLSKNGADRDAEFNDIRIRKAANTAMESYAAFTNYHLSKAILLDPTLRQLLLDVSEIMKVALEHDFSEIQKQPSLQHYMAAKHTAYAEAVQPVRDRVRNQMFTRLTDAKDPEIAASVGA